MDSFGLAGLERDGGLENTARQVNLDFISLSAGRNRDRTTEVLVVAFGEEKICPAQKALLASTNVA